LACFHNKFKTINWIHNK